MIIANHQIYMIKEQNDCKIGRVGGLPSCLLKKYTTR